jgi:ABC-type branched-subunit amino acid transport system ATPase component
MLEIAGLSKAFGSLRAVDNVTTTVKQGTITGLIGPNGAGKTTLFNLVAGAIVLDRGSISFDGQRIDNEPAHQVFHRGLVRTFQIPRPFLSMTVLENVMTAPIDQIGERFWNNWIRFNDVQQQERRAKDRAFEILSFVGLGAKVGSLAGELSGGQQKLLELARVLMVEPRLILLDEPAAGVNRALLETIIEKIVALHARGITFLLIEHNMEMVMRLCRPIIVMAQGRIILEGEPEAVRSDRQVLDAYLGEPLA